MIDIRKRIKSDDRQPDESRPFPQTQEPRHGGVRSLGRSLFLHLFPVSVRRSRRLRHGRGPRRLHRNPQHGLLSSIRHDADSQRDDGGQVRAEDSRHDIPPAGLRRIVHDLRRDHRLDDDRILFLGASVSKTISAAIVGTDYALSSFSLPGDHACVRGYGDGPRFHIG